MKIVLGKKKEGSLLGSLISVKFKENAGAWYLHVQLSVTTIFIAVS